MKRLLSITIALAMILSLASCSLFSNDSVVKLGDYTHNDPKDLKYDQRIVLKGDKFGDTLLSAMNQEAYPDMTVYDKSGNPIGNYDYDESTGIAKGWTKFEDGSYVEFKQGEEVNLGKPDESKMSKLTDNVSLYAVVYGNEKKAVSTYFYLFLKNKADKDTVKSGMESIFGLKLTDESDTVLTAVQDEKSIENEFKNIEDETIKAQDAETYAKILQQTYGIIVYKGEDAYKPYSDYKDPTDFEYDKKVVLAGSAEFAVEDEYASDVSNLTNVIYGKDGNVVATFDYYECPSKESADKIAEYLKTAKPTRVSDTVICISYTGKDMQDVIKSYIGYNVLKDASVDDYVRMIEETYYTTVCE